MQQTLYLNAPRKPDHNSNIELTKGKETRTVTVAQTSKVVRHAVQIVPVRWHLYARVIGRITRRHWFLSVLLQVWWEWRWHVVGEIEASKREINDRFDLVCEVPLYGETLEVDQQDGWQSRQGENLGGAAQCFAFWTMPEAGQDCFKNR